MRRAVIGRGVLYVCLVLCCIVLGQTAAWGQTGKEFWFDVPEINRGHTPSGSPNGYKIYLHVSALDEDAQCTLEQPANPAFTSFSFTVAKNTKKRIELSSRTNNFTDPNNPMSLFRNPFKMGTLRDCPVDERGKYIENVLDWSESDVTASRPYINRTNKGVRLYTTNGAPIMVYIEISVPWNRDIIAMKGENALGKHFFVPMQSDLYSYDGRYNNMDCSQYPSINIVATTNDTKIRIKVPTEIWLRSGTTGEYLGQTLPAGEHIIWLNRGESSIIVPYEKKSRDGRNSYQGALSPNKRLGGTEIEVMRDEGQAGDIVVLTRDDLVISKSRNPDVVADQMVPVQYAGTHFGIIRGMMSDHKDEFIYVVGTQGGTKVEVSGHGSFTINKGQQRSIRIDGASDDGVAVRSDKPVYVYHMSGVGYKTDGDQKAGALIPALPSKDICIGSKEVAFSRTMAGGFEFIMNVLAWDDTPANSSIGHFELQQQGASGFEPVTGTQKYVQDYLNDRANWHSFPGGMLPNWKYISINTDDVPGKGDAQMQAGEFAYRLVNTNNVFHLGLLNGSPGHDAFYGYFSDFKQVDVRATVLIPDAHGVLKPEGGGTIAICRGEEVDLESPSNKNYRYVWSPDKYLLTPPNRNKIKSRPEENIDYTVTVSGMCDLEKRSSVKLLVSPKAEFLLAGPTVSCGSENARFRLGAIKNATEIQWSIRRGPTGPFQDAGYSRLSKGEDTLSHDIAVSYPDHPPVPGQPVEFAVRVSALNGACETPQITTLAVYPKVPKPTIAIASADPPSSCSPVTNTFSLTSSVPFPAGATYYWLFGNGNTSRTSDPGLQTFTNHGESKQTLRHRLYVEDAFGVCKDSGEVTSVVYPQVSAQVYLAPLRYCEPWRGTIGATMKGETSRTWQLYRDGNPVGPTASGTTYLPTSELMAKEDGPQKYTIELKATNGVCSASDKLDFYVDPKAQFKDVKVEYPEGKSCSPLKVRVTVTGVSNTGRYSWRLKKSKYDATGFLLKKGGTTSGGDLVLEEWFSNPESEPVRRILELTLTNDGGCDKKHELEIDIPPMVEASFLAKTVTGCPDVNGRFEATLVNASQAPDGSTYTWELDGEPLPKLMGSENFTYQFNNTSFTDVREHKVRMGITTRSGCTSYDEATVTIYPRVRPTLSATYDLDGVKTTLSPGIAICAPKTATFVGNGASTYTWTFSDGTPMAEKIVTKTLANTTDAPLNYTVHMWGSNAYGCSASVESKYVVYPQLKADFVANVVEPCSPVVVQIKNLSLPAAGLTYDWNFDGGVPDAADPMKLVYERPGMHTIKLKVRNDFGCVDEAKPYTFEVNDVVKAALGRLTAKQSRVCSPAQIEFQSNSIGADYAKWTFGDGKDSITGGAARVKHTYINKTTDPVTYTVMLRVGRDDFGCDDGPNSLAITQVTIFPEVSALSSSTVTEYCNPVSVSLTNGSENADTYTWKFTPDDPESGSEQSITVNTLDAQEVRLENTAQESTVNYKGVFTASKQWLNGPTCHDDMEVGIIAVPPELRQNIVADVDMVCSGSEVVFTNLSTGGELAHSFNFGDGKHLETTWDKGVIRHTYENTNPSGLDAVYRVKVESKQRGVTTGCPKTFELPITVHPRVNAAFETAIGDKCEVPLPVTFTDASTKSKATSGVTTQYSWDFGDGQKAERTSGAAFVHEYKNTNPDVQIDYKVRLLVEQKHEVSGLTCSSEVEHVVSVLPVVVPQLVADATEGCGKLKVKFRSPSKGGQQLRYYWDFGDGETAGGQEVEHVFSNKDAAEKIYKVALKVNNEYECERDVSVDIKVYPEVEASFDIDWDNRCTPFGVVVSNTSLNGTDYFWSLEGDSQVVAPKTDKKPFTITFDNESPEEDKHVNIVLNAVSVYKSTYRCTSKMSREVVVPPRLVAEFAPSLREGCNPATVSFENMSSGKIKQYSWDLGGVTSSLLQTPPSVTFSNADTQNDRVYPIKLEVTNADGCVATKDVDVTIYPKVESLFAANVYKGCTPLSVELHSTATSPAYSYDWQLGGGHPNATEASPGKFVYENNSNPPRLFETDITLITSLTAHPECQVPVSKKISVYPSVYPEFSTLDAGCPVLEVPVTNSSVFFGKDADYQWSIDGGVVSADAAPTFHLENTSATESRTYNLRLKVTSQHQCVGEVEKSVVVYPQPQANFTIRGTNMTCPPSEIVVENAAKGNGLSYVYDFSDGTTIRTEDGAAEVKHPYDNLDTDVASYVVSQDVKSADGCVDRTTQIVYVYPRVTAEFNILPSDMACSPFLADLSNHSINAHSYSWDFGDGGTDAHHSPAHRFLNNGLEDTVYPVKLRAFSQYGCSDEKSLDLTVWATPNAKFEVSPTVQTFPASTVTIDNQSLVVKSDWSYRWDFGDGETARDKDVGYHTYTKWGPKEDDFTFPITLTVENAHCLDQAVKSVIILPPHPVSEFSFDRGAGCPPLKTQFYNRSSFADQFLWEFGDGTTSKAPEPEHTFNDPQLYHVRLNVRGDGGEHYSYQLIEVYPRPVVNFKLIPEEKFLPDAEIHALNLSILGTSYFWDFGDGIQSQEESPHHKYQDPGEYTVRLVAQTDRGCSDSLVKNNAVRILGSGEVTFPNAFKPNPAGPNGGYYVEGRDLKNEVFHPYVKGAVDEYKLMIFNRWGEQIFESTDIAVGWDGYIHGTLSPMGVYAWRAIGTFFDGTQFNLKGNVTLLR